MRFLKTAKYIYLYLILCLPFAAAAQTAEEAETAIGGFFQSYAVAGYAPHGSMKADSVRIDSAARRIDIYCNEPFSSQPFTPERLESVYKGIASCLPKPFAKHSLQLYSHKGVPMEVLVPNMLRKRGRDEARRYGDKDFRDNPWVENISLPYKITAGLQGRHLFIWPSHGRYFRDGEWRWQRPRLYCTREDLLSRSIVIPYLFPMLENAGAVIGCPVERDFQSAEVIVDNDGGNRRGVYTETNGGAAAWHSFPDSVGFGFSGGLLTDSTRLFGGGTVRYAEAANHLSNEATAMWIPRFGKAGRYAVYVSYLSLANSIPDALYTVCHKGGRTQFRVNQRMGGGTWVYLGTFEFDEGLNQNNCVILSSYSKHKGTVTADAVRFGGGMGQADREGLGTSGVARAFEAARYYTQWAGLADTLFNTEQGASDYRDDLRTRSHYLNTLTGGSTFLPDTLGRGVPFELSLALHTDAGIRRDGNVYGSLAICTAKHAAVDSVYKSGVSRYASYDLADALLSGMVRDLAPFVKGTWTRRELWDRNYAETRMPGVPSAILEMLSHQNFTDMKYAHDPLFKFQLARSVYKTLLRFTAFMHDGAPAPVVQPLPPHGFSALLDADGQSVTLSWSATVDSLEETAKPDTYIIYTRLGNGDFDNGQIVRATNHPRVQLPIREGVVYSFRVAAANAGGVSFPSETLCAYKAPREKARVLIVNGFDRLSGPARIETTDSVGFVLEEEIGVPYIAAAPYCGRQTNFAPLSAASEGADAPGYSTGELEGETIAGNTFDFAFEHGAAMLALEGTSFCSCSRAAVEDGGINLKDYRAIDFIGGLQRLAPQDFRRFKLFTPRLVKAFSDYMAGGGRMLASGAFLGTDLTAPAEMDFAKNVLHYAPQGRTAADSLETVRGLNMEFDIYRVPSAAHYAAQRPDVLMPHGEGAFSAFCYADGRGAGTAFRTDRNAAVVMGFPFECIKDAERRRLAMRAILRFLLE